MRLLKVTALAGKQGLNRPKREGARTPTNADVLAWTLHCPHQGFR